jgi:hypothetical protein
VLPSPLYSEERVGGEGFSTQKPTPLTLTSLPRYRGEGQYGYGLNRAPVVGDYLNRYVAQQVVPSDAVSNNASR